MEYRNLGSSGLQVSAVGLGTNNFGGRLDLNATDAVIKRSVDQGINLLDTSNSYGDSKSEEFIGKSVKGIRDQVVLATKVASPRGDSPNSRGASRKHIMDQVEMSLKRLQTDYIDLYQIHFQDPNTPIEETLRTLDDLVRQGKVRYVGCSNFKAWQVAQAMERSSALGLEHFVSVQPSYSMLKREVEEELVPCCTDYGIGILPYFPLASGFLTGKYRRGETPPEGTRLAGNSTMADTYLTEANFDVLEALEAFASERGHSMVELAIAWLLANRSVSSVIAGATRPEQVDANAKAADWELGASEMEELAGILSGTS
jgi:aryl-alcohol dehydrogenase-like predicted oxidoreductase